MARKCSSSTPLQAVSNIRIRVGNPQRPANRTGGRTAAGPSRTRGNDMKTLAKWLAIGTLAPALFSLMPRYAVAQDDGGQVGFDDPTAMAAPPPQFIAPADIKKLMDSHDASFQLVDTQPEAG